MKTFSQLTESLAAKAKGNIESFLSGKASSVFISSKKELDRTKTALKRAGFKHKSDEDDSNDNGAVERWANGATDIELAYDYASDYNGKFSGSVSHQ